MTIIVNLFAGPGAGKSTMAAGLFYRLKMAGVNCELVREFAKDLTWEGSHTALSNQLYVTAHQHHRQFILDGKVDVIVTDSPLVIGLFYMGEPEPEVAVPMKVMLLSMFAQQKNLNFFIRRVKAYNPAGRNQTEDEAKELDQEMLEFLMGNRLGFNTVDGSPQGLDRMAALTLEALEYAKNPG